MSKETINKSAIEKMKAHLEKISPEDFQADYEKVKIEDGLLIDDYLVAFNERGSLLCHKMHKK